MKINMFVILWVVVIWIYLCHVISVKASEENVLTDLDWYMAISDIQEICTGDKTETIFREMRYKPTFLVQNCPLPDVSYASRLQGLDKNISLVSRLVLQNLPPESHLQARHFAGLSIQSLIIIDSDIHMENKTSIRADDNFLEPLVKTLTELKIENVQLPPIPERMQITNIDLMSGASTGAFGGCVALQKLTIKNWQVPEFAGDWLAHCPKLQDLKLSQLSLRALQSMLQGVNILNSLTVNEVDLKYISADLFKDAASLRRLDLSNNKIQVYDSDTFKFKSNLQELDLSNNNLQQSALLGQTLASLKALRSLSLANNPVIDYCDAQDYVDKSLPLERLILKGTNLRRLCFGLMVKLLYLDVSGNEITSFQFDELPIPGPLYSENEVDLRDNPISEFPNTEDYYKLMVERFQLVQNMIVHIDVSLDCDCNYAWFARALHSLPQFTLAGARCSNGLRLQKVPPQQLECEKWHCEVCTCRTAWHDNTTDVDCRKWRDEVSETECRAQLKLEPDIIVDKLDNMPENITIDLRGNDAWRISKDAAESLLALRERRVWLAGNAFKCDCGNLPLLTVLHNHSEQILDFNSMACTNGRTVRSVNLDTLCPKPVTEGVPTFVYPTVSVFLVIAGSSVAFAITMCYRYKRKIKEFLYTRGYCLSCLHEEEIDCDREYDAFISFSHEDDHFVNTELLPGISDYNLCIHYRNWVAGDWIPAQIARSIENSRRTLIVLSKNFLASAWGMFEFRQAYASTLQEGRARIVVVVIDDVIDDPELDEELRRYLTTYTYVEWGDPLFWSKLKFALPHRSRLKTQDTAGSTVESNAASVTDDGIQLQQITPSEDLVTAVET